MFEKILVAVDLDEPQSWGDSVPVAASIAKCFSGAITICFVVRDAEVIRQGNSWPSSYREKLFEAQARLEGLAARLNVPVKTEIGSGSVAGGVMDVAERIGADLIILSSHQPQATDRLFAANAARVARRAHCSVLVVRASPGD